MENNGYLFIVEPFGGGAPFAVEMFAFCLFAVLLVWR